jgi:hypothetical protein
VSYFECSRCDFIFADTQVLEKADAGEFVREYDTSYWQMELASARERAFGPCMARLAETLLYSRIPVQRFVDIYTGPGFFLDAVQRYLPHVTDRFYGVELYPPPDEFRTKHPNYFVGDLASLEGKFQAGVCIEVLEHLTPRMAAKLAWDLAGISDPQALFLFNTGLVNYVKNEDPAYLDPFKRGHISIWSVSAARKVFEPAGFSVFPISGKTWAFIAEYESRDKAGPVNDRIWSPSPENKAILADPGNGSLLYVLGLDTARAR